MAAADLADSEDIDDSDDDPDYRGSDVASSVSCRTYESDELAKKTKSQSDAESSEDAHPLEKKRKGDRTAWKKNVAKRRRNLGKTYLSNAKNPKKIPARTVGPPCSDKCKLQCSKRIRQELRENFFRTYWAMGSLQSQREYIGKLIDEVEPEYRYKKIDSSRGLNHVFSFFVGEEKVRVCKQFFAATLGITNRAIRTVMSKKKGGVMEEDKRGKFKKISKSQTKQGIRDHINSIPRIESHYLRAHTTREFIEGGKTLSDLYRDYSADCSDKNVKCGSRSMYVQVFKKEFNISFFTPKKDQCDLCLAYTNAVGADKERLQSKYEIHLKEKELSRQEKEQDKQVSTTTTSHVVAMYDLQAVLPAPRGEASSFYYKSKINSYNLTLCDVASDEVHCFLWHEGEGNRGAIEIGSCVFKYLTSLSDSKSSQDLEVTLFSDNCSGQQKNKFVFAMYLYAVQVLQIKSITHKFLIAGHTQNEGDNVHSVIEKAVKKALKSGPIYVPSEYARIIRSAKKNWKAL